MTSPFANHNGRKVFDPRNPKAKSKGNKYGARKAACQHGHKHDSQKEARRCNELHLLQRAGEITALESQPQFWFVINGKQVKHEGGRRVGYRADFSYHEKGKTIVEDVKGAYRDDAWTLRKAIFLALFPDVELRII